MITPEKDIETGVTSIGPECFASTDGRVVCWRGVNYYPWASDPEHQLQPAPMPGARRALLDIIVEVDNLDEPGPAADWIRMLAEYGLGRGPHPGDAPARYPCCEHCEHDPGYEPDRHTVRCPDGCNGPVT